MPTHFSLLRGINVSGQKTIHMADLKNLYEALGFSDVRSYVQSGNVVFAAANPDPATLAASIEAQIRQTFGFDVSVFVRSAPDFQGLLKANPFLHGRSEDPARLHVTFLYALPAAVKLSALEKPAAGNDEFLIAGREIFLFCPDGYGRTKLSNAFFERKLAVPATTRSWNTVNALLQMAQATP
jgi:uncharacterized protein (DUF1697 family)